MTKAPYRSRAGAAALAAASAIAVAAAAAPASAQDFSADSQAAAWNLAGGEEKMRFEGQVVDVLCELAGDCAENCGDGRRQLGLVRAADGALLLAGKNVQPVFSGAVVDLLPYCGDTVEVDGLLVGAPPHQLYQVQLVRRVGDAEFAKTNLFTKDWAEKNPAQEGGKGPWFRRDPRITDRTDANGYFGLGLEVDEVYIEETFGE